MSGENVMCLSRFSVILLLTFPNLYAQTLSFDEAVQRFLTHNPDVKIAYNEAQKSRADRITANEHPNPIINGSYEFMDIQHNFGDKARGSNAQATLIFSHPFETAGKREKRISVAEHAIAYNDHLYNQALRQQLEGLVSAYYGVLSDQITLQNALENAKAYDQIIAIAKAKYDNGFLSQIDYQKIALQKTDYLREAEESRLSLANNRETLASLLAFNDSDITIESAPPLPTLSQDPKALMEKIPNRPDCKAAKENLALADASVKLEEAIAVPNVSAGIEYASFGPYYEPLLGFNFSIPLPIYDKNEGDIQKARIGTLQAAALYDKTVREAKADIARNLETLRSRQRVHQALSEGFATAKELKEKEEKIFAIKGISILELFDVQKNFREFQKNLTRSTIDVQIADAMLRLSTADFTPLSKGN